MELTASNIQAVLKDCLFKDDELPENPTEDNLPEHVKAQGVMNQFAFHPARLESHREDVKSMLEQLADDFMHDKGGGMSLMQMPFTRDGVQYGEQRDADLLFVLGAGMGYCSFVLPREMWRALPGGMPYIVVNL